MPNGGDGFWGGGNIQAQSGLPKQPQAGDSENTIIANRLHPVIQVRGPQLALNMLALHGGRPYIEERLSRYAGETKAEWAGGTRKDGSTVTGRKDRTHNVPILRRMVAKLNQYIFQTAPSRPDADPLILADINRNGLHVNRFMQRAARIASACKWGWIGVDVPQLPADTAGPVTQAQKNKSGVRPYWTLYDARQVVDWEFDSRGKLIWALCEGAEWDDSASATVIRVRRRVRKLWEPGQLTTYRYDDQGKEIVSSNQTPLLIGNGKPMTKVPLIPFGEIDDEPHEFDDMEGIQRTILDLESANRENFFKAVYPQKYLPAGVVENAKNAYSVEGDEAVSMILGLGYPILVEKDDVTPGIIEPGSASVGAMRVELNELKDAMKECFGMMMQKQTRQVESAEAKAWDHLDVEAVISSYAEILEDVETKAVAMSALWDADFKPWVPSYSRDFDVGDFKSEIESLLLADSMPNPHSMRRAIRRKVTDRLDRIGSRLSDDERTQIMDDIDSWNPDPLMIPIDDDGQGA